MKNNTDSLIGHLDDLPPIEEYLRMMERIISSNKLSPRRIQKLKEIMRRYEPCEEHKSAMCNILACRQSKIPEFSEPFTTKKNENRKYSTVSSGIEMVSEDISKSLSNKIASKAINGSEKISFSIIQTTNSQNKDGNRKELEKMLRKIPFKTSKVSLDTVRKEEAAIQQRQASAKSNFENLLKEACNLEPFTIDNPFPDFSLQNIKLNKIFQQYDIEEILEQSKSLFYEPEASTSKNIVDNDKKYEKGTVRFVNKITEEKTDILELKEAEVLEEKIIENQKICKCQ